MATAGLAAAVAGIPRSPIERIRDLWVADPGIRHVPHVDLSVAPTLGGAYLSLGGSF